MSAFLRALRSARTASAGRRWLFVPYDQLTDRIGPLAQENAGDLGVVLVENRWQYARRPYHKQKLASLIANMRHFALEQADRGVAVRYETADAPYREALRPLIRELGPLHLMEPAERELRADLRPLLESGGLAMEDHAGWLTTPQQLREAHRRGPPWRMDAFYRHVRRATGVLMREGRPEGGKFSFDTENRRPWLGTPRPPRPPQFPLDSIKEEVCSLIESEFSHHPGRLDARALAATQSDAERLWSWARRACLPHFGPYEDAMSVQSTGLFHTRISALVNLHRLLPARVLSDALKQRIPFPSREGFVRQILGWREFVRHVHRESDGFRHLPSGDPQVSPVPGDAGRQRWSGEAWPAPDSPADLDGGARPHALGWRTPLPPAYWGTASGLRCLDIVVADVWREGWSHHITRLVILCGLALLLDVSPRELTDWFWVAYVDAYDWVVEPNVLGMGMFAVGDYMSTKPYATGASYINRMSDYCPECGFDPRRTCPIRDLYWAFLSRHEKALAGNPRMGIALAAMRRRTGEDRRRDRRVYQTCRRMLVAGQQLLPDTVASGRTAPRRRQAQPADP